MAVAAAATRAGNAPVVGGVPTSGLGDADEAVSTTRPDPTRGTAPLELAIVAAAAIERADACTNVDGGDAAADPFSSANAASHCGFVHVDLRVGLWK